jgi:hypothetical protein
MLLSRRGERRLSNALAAVAIAFVVVSKHINIKAGHQIERLRRRASSNADVAAS